MKTVTFTEFKQMKLDEIKEGPCLEVTFNCEHLGLFIVGAVEGMKSKLLVQASQIDAMRGVDKKSVFPITPVFDESDFIKQID